MDPLTGFGYNGPVTLAASEFSVMIKQWCRNVRAKLEKPKRFVRASIAIFPFLMKNYESVQVYFSKSNESNSLIIAYWDEEANAVMSPKFIFFEDSLIKEKY